MSLTHANSSASNTMKDNVSAVEAHYARPQATGAATHASTVSLNEPPNARAVRQILIVDDNQDSAEAMAMMLEYLGYEVSVAFSGQASLDELERRTVDVVLLDLGLPDMHGTAVAEQMRSRGFAGKVIAFSGNSELSMKERCGRAGMDHFVVKPCSMESLRALL